MEEKISGIVAGELKRIGVESVVAGISGGADSVALFIALFEAGIRLKCVHCNFHLRGEESMRDQRHVEALCKRYGADLTVIDFDVEGYRKKHGGSLEMACRDLRYAEFRKIREEGRFDRIAVAHNSDDNAETLLLNLVRGTGIAGLRGMKKDTGEIIRPLLDVSRKEIENYILEKKETYIVDSTNLESDYRRNFLRNQVIPLIESRWPGVKDALKLTAHNIAEEERALIEYERKLTGESTLLRYDALRLTANPGWLIRRFVVSFGGSNEIAEEICRNLSSEDIRIGRRWTSADGEFVTGPEGLEWLAGEAMAPGSDVDALFQRINHENTPELMEGIVRSRGNHTFWLPADVAIKLRTRRAGDRIRPLGMKGSRLVSDVVSDARLSAADKRDIVVAEEEETGEILWVEGLKRSRKCLVTPENKIITEIVRK